MKRDYYETLGCQEGASIEEIKAAYRKLAKELHPDKNTCVQPSEYNFKEISEAYDVLRSEMREGRFDRGDQSGLPQARQRAASRQKSRQSSLRAQIQGNQRGL